MRFSSLAFLLALLLPGGMAEAQTQLPSGTSHFAILQNDKTVGSSEFTVAPTAAGYTITSRGELRLTLATAFPAPPPRDSRSRPALAAGASLYF